MQKIIRYPFEGEYKHTQGFGANPKRYKKFGIKGHNGDDWGMPMKTEILMPFDGIITKIAVSSEGYGLYVQAWDQVQNLLAIFAHLESTNISIGQVVKTGDEIARSGNSGNSTGPHLHFAVAYTGDDGKRLDVDNGFGGWYSMLNSEYFYIAVGAPKPTKQPEIATENQTAFIYEWMVMVNQKLDELLEQGKP